MNKTNTRRADGRLQSRVYLGDGKYRYVLARTQKDLDRKVMEVKMALGKGIDVSAESDTFGEWAERWLEIKEMEVSYKRYTAYKGNIKMLSPLCRLSLTKLRPVDFQTLFTRLHREGLSVATLEACKSAAKQVFDLAVANRVTDFNPLPAVRLPKGGSASKRRALTPTERQWIIDTPHRAQTAAMLMMFAGLRRGELIALTWEDIDFEAKTINIHRSAEQGKDTGLIIKDGAKSEYGVRIVDMPDILTEYLANTTHIGEFVCPTAKGKMLTETAWKRLWNSYLAELNFKYGDFPEGYQKPNSRFAPQKIPFVIPRFTSHWLRHTYITMLYLAGVDVMTAKELAGHAEISTTLEIYTHLDREYKRNQMDKLDEYISKNGSRE